MTLPAPTRSLPARASLTQLRKQAREFLRAFRDGDAHAVAEVRRFERDPDASILELHDAHRVLARAYGYASWTKLKQHVDAAGMESAVRAGDRARVRELLRQRPELVRMDRSTAESISLRQSLRPCTRNT